MHSAHRRRDNCRLCLSPEVKVAVPLRPSPVAGDYPRDADRSAGLPAYPMDLYLCLECGHLQLLDVVDPQVLFGDYTYVTASSLGLVEHFLQQARQVAERVTPGPVVEIGSNDGTLLKHFVQVGFGPVVGVDPAGRLAQGGGVTTRCEWFTRELARELRAELGPVKVVAANNVFAHTDDLGGMADGVAALLADDGLFVFEVSYVRDIVERMLFDTVYHEHLCYHAVRPLARFLAAHGLELCEVQRIPTKGGSLRGFARLPRGAAPHPSVAELVQAEEEAGLLTLACYQQFSARIESAGRALRERLQATGGRVAGYGASHTVTTLVHQYQLQDFLDFLVDDNPAKQGTYCPGTRLQVLPSADLYRERPEVVVILAWAYSDPILQRHPGLGEFAHVLVPLPELREIPR